MADANPKEDENKKNRNFNISGFVSTIITASLALLSVWFGAYLTNWSAKDSAHHAKIEEMKLSSYVDFANARERLIKGSPEEKKSAAGPAEEAAHRIAIYGDGPVVHAIAEEWRKGHYRPPCPAGFLPDLAVNQAMRSAAAGTTSDTSTPGDLAVILYGCDVMESTHKS